MGTARQFTMQDQERFAVLTGDSNPMHMDVVAARRTAAAVPAVHGIHHLLWCLDVIAQGIDDLPSVASLRVNFDTFVAVGDTVCILNMTRDATGIRAQVGVNGMAALTLRLTFGAAQPASAVPAVSGEVFDSDRPIDLSLDQIDGRSGRVRAATSPATIAAVYPHAARLLGASRVAGLGCMTRLVGMACPGLHSIFNGLSLKTCEMSDADAPEIGYRVSDCNRTFRRIVQEVGGLGWLGTVTCTARQPPILQPSIDELRGLVPDGLFRGTVALVVGGSRGLGELTAKLIAVGGGEVIVTYAQGRSDAESVIRSIRSAGGAASAMRYNVLEAADAQLAQLDRTPNQLYYFATPNIGISKGAPVNNERFSKFFAYYVTGFADLTKALAARTQGGLSVFYPSTIFIEERPAGMTEYAMAKAAGEVLCADLASSSSHLKVFAPRLPKLATDQTAGAMGDDNIDSVDVMLPHLKTMSCPPG